MKELLNRFEKGLTHMICNTSCNVLQAFLIYWLLPTSSLLKYTKQFTVIINKDFFLYAQTDKNT